MPDQYPPETTNREAVMRVSVIDEGPTLALDALATATKAAAIDGWSPVSSSRHHDNRVTVAPLPDGSWEAACMVSRTVTLWQEGQPF